MPYFVKNEDDGNIFEIKSEEYFREIVSTTGWKQIDYSEVVKSQLYKSLDQSKQLMELLNRKDLLIDITNIIEKI